MLQVFIAHPGLTRTDHFGKADTDAKWSSAGVEAFANSFWGTDANMGAIPLVYACVESSLAGKQGPVACQGQQPAGCRCTVTFEATSEGDATPVLCDQPGS